jgi:hypothetical protein
VALLIVAWLVLMGGPTMGDTADIFAGLVQMAVMLAVNLWALRPLRAAPHPAAA